MFMKAKTLLILLINFLLCFFRKERLKGERSYGKNLSDYRCKRRSFGLIKRRKRKGHAGHHDVHHNNGNTCFRDLQDVKEINLKKKSLEYDCATANEIEEEALMSMLSQDRQWSYPNRGERRRQSIDVDRWELTRYFSETGGTASTRWARATAAHYWFVQSNRGHEYIKKERLSGTI